MRDWGPHLAPGEFATIPLISADKRAARTLQRYVSGLLNGVPMLKGVIENETADSITLKGRVIIETHTASFRSIRGYSVAAALLDETAFWISDETSRNPDVEILRAIRPALATLPGSMLIQASSPYAKRGVLYDAYQRHYGKDDAPVLLWKAPSLVMNPSLDPRLVDEAYAADPEAAAAEYGAEFRADVSGFLDRAVVDGAVDRGVVARPPLPNVTYHAFADPSGGSGDAFTCAVAHAEPDGAIVLDALFERRPPFSPPDVVREIAGLLREYRVGAVMGDKYAAGWVPAAFKECGIEYRHSQRDRSALYLEVLPLFTSGRARLLDNTRLIAQLSALERRSGAGRDRVDHPPGQHDDLANSAAGALVLAAQPKQKLKVVMPYVATRPRELFEPPTSMEPQDWSNTGRHPTWGY
jgi:hypothetical protein